MQRCEGVEVSGEVWHKKHLLHQYFLTAVATLHVFSRQKHPQFLKALTTQPGPRYTTVCTASLLSDPACMAYDTTPSPHRTAVIFWCKAVVDGSGFALTRLPACRADFQVFIFNFSAMCWICTTRKRSALYANFAVHTSCQYMHGEPKHVTLHAQCPSANAQSTA